MTATEFDYIIVGAGSAGCVLANRLSAMGGVSVCVIEGGGSESAPNVTVPRGSCRSMAIRTTTTPMSARRNPG